MSSASPWAENEWVSAGERRRATASFVIPAVVLLVGGGLYLAGLVGMVRSLTMGLTLIIAGLVLVLLIIPLAMLLHPYRRMSSDEVPATLFHISPSVWEIGDGVLLRASRSRRKQPISERWWSRRVRMVYFFSQRPMRRHAKSQSYVGRRRTPHYLYELAVQHPIEPVYIRGAALATTADVAVVVVDRQELGSSWRRGRHERSRAGA